MTYMYDKDGKELQENKTFKEFSILCHFAQSCESNVLSMCLASVHCTKLITD